MKKAFLFVASFVLLAAGMTMGQSGTYTMKNLQPATRDITTITNTVSAWKAFGAGFRGGSIAVGTDSLWAIKIDGYIYRFNPVSKTWDQQTNMNHYVYMLAVQDSANIFALVGDSQCPGQYGLYFWMGTNGWQKRTGCYMQISAGVQAPNHNVPPGILAAINNNWQLTYSTDGGTTWTLQSGTWTGINLGRDGYGCAVDSSHNPQEIVAGHAPDPLPTIPNVNGQVVGCLFATDPTTVLAWTSTGYVYAMPLENFGTWQVVTGISAQRLAGQTRYFLYGEDTGANVYHWNVNAFGATATYGGQWNQANGCPTPSSSCHSSTTHTVNGHIYFASGHGIDGVKRSTTGPFLNDLETYPADFNPLCDPFVGLSGDVECQMIVEGDSICNQSLQSLGSTKDQYDWGVSTSILWWIQNHGGTDPVDYGTPAGGVFRALVTSEAWLGCKNGVTPTCAPPQDTEGNTPIASTLTCAYYDMYGYGACDDAIWDLYYDYLEGKPSPWVSYQPWWSKNGVVSCIPINIPLVPYWNIQPPVDCN